ncbi:MAG TPA: hypothetical protein VEB88_00220 [Candidatus Acidoferrales bacterium]|jgi:hypothetical protein|nr:hypothetical protein [Candidatus Acidoferrales bacterium]
MQTEPIDKVVNCYYHLYGECAKGELRIKDGACLLCLARALQEISSALRAAMV